MELRPFQNEALERILESYNSGRKSALLIMPAGTGKTVLSVNVFKRMIDDHNLDSMAYVTTTINMQLAFDSMVEESVCSGSKTVKSYSYNELADLIQEDSIVSDEFQLLIFDDLIENNPSLINKIYSYFNGFKIGFSRTDLPDNRLIFKNNDEGGIAFKYSLKQAVIDGYFLTSQKALYRHALNHLQFQLRDIEIGTDWSQTISQPLIQQIDVLKNENEEYLEAQKLLLSGKVNTAEILEMSHRKEQLDEFNRLLNDKSYFDERAEKANGVESVWRNFFEFNPWIFGFGLNFIFNSPLDGKKLEQTIEGYSVKGHGKRTDALLKTTGLIQTLCFGEIKTHRKNILKATKMPYRSESWAISDELAGGIAQIHRTIHNSLNNLNNALSLYDEGGCKLRDPIYLYKPKSFLIIGSLNEFKSKNGDIHEDKFSSFELFRRSISDIEIITFDELYERANALINKKWNKTG